MMRILIRDSEGQDRKWEESVLPKQKVTISMTTKEAQYLLLGYTAKTTDGKLIKPHKRTRKV